MKKFYTHKIIINKEQNLLRLDQALANLSNLSRSRIKNLISSQKIEKNDVCILEPSLKVKIGETYILYPASPIEDKFEAEDIPLNIIYEDNDIIIINKSAGMVTHPAPGNYSGTVVNALLNYNKNQLSSVNEANRPGIVHRLDKETSGLLVIAKNNESHEKLALQFKNHTISRKYKALVWGIPNKQSIEGYIGRNKINRKKMSLNKNNEGRYSKTLICPIKSYQIASLVECKLETGRTHQVRVHMSSIKSPLIGDKVYGSKKLSQFNLTKDTNSKFMILKNFSRQALHAFHLGFIHPSTNEYIEFNSKLPKDMQDLLNLILKY